MAWRTQGEGPEDWGGRAGRTQGEGPEDSGAAHGRQCTCRGRSPPVRAQPGAQAPTWQQEYFFSGSLVTCVC